MIESDAYPATSVLTNHVKDLAGIAETARHAGVSARLVDAAHEVARRAEANELLGENTLASFRI